MAASAGLVAAGSTDDDEEGLVGVVGPKEVASNGIFMVVYDVWKVESIA